MLRPIDGPPRVRRTCGKLSTPPGNATLNTSGPSWTWTDFRQRLKQVQEPLEIVFAKPVTKVFRNGQSGVTVVRQHLSTSGCYPDDLPTTIIGIASRGRKVLANNRDAALAIAEDLRDRIGERDFERLLDLLESLAEVGPGPKGSRNVELNNSGRR